MKTYLTIADLMLRLRIPQSNYTHFRNWCHKNKDKLDTQLCKWNNGYTLYNVNLVREKYPFPGRFGLDKVSTPEPVETPAETPIDAAERLAAAINTATGKNITAGDVMAAFERGMDYIRMRKQMARTLWRMRKERRLARIFSRIAVSYSNHCCSAKIAAESAADSCKNYSESYKVTADFIREYHTRAFDVSRNAEKAARMMNVIMFTIFVICVVTIGTVYEIVN